MKALGRILGAHVWSAAACAAVLGLLATMAWWAGDARAVRADVELREQLIRHAVQMADTINPELARRLTFTSADAGTPAFERLREQMLAYRRVMGSGELVSMRLGDGVIRFGPETLSVNDPGAHAPGSPYAGAPSAVIDGLRTGQPFVRGPLQTKGGPFVFAAAPVVDSASGETLMMIGINRAADDWLSQVGAARRGPWLSALVVVLLVAGAALAVRWRRRHVRRDTLTFKRSIVVPTALAMLVGPIFLGSYQYRQITQSARRDMVRMTEQVDRRWHRNIVSQVQILKAQIDVMAGDPALLAAWRDRNVPALTAVAQPALQRMTLDYGITHFNLLAPDRTCVLRAQQPDQRGDIVDRVTLRMAERTGADAWGIEVGPRGGVTLRYVRPWTHAGATTGYVELGIETSRLSGQLAKDMSVDLLTVIRKTYTTRASFEAGRQAFGLSGQWETYPDFVVAHQTLARLPVGVEQWLGQPHSPMAQPEVFETQQEGRRFGCGVIHQPDVEGRDLTQLVVIRDVTVDTSEARSAILMGLGIAAVLFGGVLVLLWSVTGTAEHQLSESFTQVQESASRLQAITDSAQDAILMMDPDGRISYWNPAAERVFGHTAGEALGQNLHALIVPARYHDAQAASFPAFLQTGQGAAIGASLDLEGIRKGGEEIAVQLSLSGVQLHGRWHSVGIIRDITERTRTLAAIERQLLDIELARDAQERNSAELVELVAKLDVEKKRSQDADLAKSEFLANMSHEIRTPMNGVIGMTGLLLDTDLSSEQRQYAEIVRTSGEALLAIVNDILDFSKIEARKLDLETLDFDLRATLEDTSELLAIKAHEKGLDLVCFIDPDVPVFLRGDPGRLRQILLNLGSNAVKFTQAGGVTVRASLVSEDPQGVVVRFAVTDTGIGIPADRQQALFSPFTQVDGSTTRKYGGTGLGLAISKQLSELMGGTVGLESQEGRGSTFWFTAVFQAQPARQAPAPPPRANLAGVRVLVVDDHDTNRLLVSTLLKHWGCRFAEATNGAQALAMLEDAARVREPFAVALLDRLMPGMDGIELGRQIKARADIHDTRLIMMTSLAGRGDASQLTALGFAGYLSKPLRQSLLEECISLVVGRDEPTTATGASATGLVTRHTVSEANQRRVRILLAEDNATNQLVALKILEKLGYRADAVANGLEAVVALREIPYDLVLMDCQMPEMDGFDATRQIRSPESAVRNHGVPIIAMTANAMKGDRERCLDAGMDDYLSKPVMPAELKAMIERWMTKAQT